MNKINVAIVGLGFGGCFPEIYKYHPNVNTVGVFDTDKNRLDTFADRLGLKKYRSFEEILEDKSIDAVHLVTPIPLHEDQTVKVLEAGKHCEAQIRQKLYDDGNNSLHVSVLLC